MEQQLDKLIKAFRLTTYLQAYVSGFLQYTDFTAAGLDTQGLKFNSTALHNWAPTSFNLVLHESF